MFNKSPIILYILIFTLLNLPVFAEVDSSAYKSVNATEFLLSETNYIVAAFDDWGLNGSLSSYGLPEYASEIYYQTFGMTDPLYGSIPFSWLNPRHQDIKVDSLTDKIILTPVFSDSGVNYSRFDYYRGDYGFLNFSAILAGNISENIYWRLSGEKLGYDGAYGLLGPDIYAIKESIIQNFFLDIRKITDRWQFDLGGSYQKYFPGWMETSVQGIANDETYLYWEHNGRLKEYRTSLYVLGTRFNKNGTLKTGLQFSNFLYNTTNDTSIYRYKAETFHYSGIINWEIPLGPGRLALESRPTLESIFIQHGNFKKRITYRQQLSFTYGKRQLFYRLCLGSANSAMTPDLTVKYNLSKHISASSRSEITYIQYPLSFYTEIGGIPGNKPNTDGFSAFRQSLALKLSFGASYLQSRFDYRKADFLMPSKTSVSTGNYTLVNKNLNRYYLTEEFKFQLPWRFDIKGRAIFSPAYSTGNDLMLQAWSRLSKDIFLFKGNLHLYLSGDIYYLTGPKSVVWFEQLRTQAMTDVNYFTNERLSLSGIIGARIGPFHMFYSVYNAEGRAFSALPGQLYRNRVKVFGVDWIFKNQ